MLIDHKSGFSRIELVVVIFIVLILFSLLLPALDRGSHGGGAMCRNNLQLIGIAMHSYHDAHKCFPPGITSYNLPNNEYCIYVAKSDRCDDPRVSRSNALTNILPFLDQAALYQSYNHSLACCAIQNATVASSRIDVFLCPQGSNG